MSKKAAGQINDKSVQKILTQNPPVSIFFFTFSYLFYFILSFLLLVLLLLLLLLLLSSSSLNSQLVAFRQLGFLILLCCI